MSKALLLTVTFFAFFVFVNIAKADQITVSIIQNGPMVTDTLDDGTIITFPTSSDDAEQENDEMDALTDDDIDAGWEGAPDDQNILIAGFRFQNIAVPQGSMIDEAYIEVVSHEAKNSEDVARINLVGEASDNAQTYSLEELISDRPETQAKVLWEVNEEWGLWETYKSADIKNIIQEIVNRQGWNEGNSIAIMLKGEDQGPSDLENAREMESFENIADPEEGGDGQNHPDRVPKLFIRFQKPTSISDLKTETLAPKIFPNPSAGKVIINFESNATSDVFIYDMLGNEVYRQHELTARSIELDLRNLSTGAYYIKTVQGGAVYSQQIIID